MAKNNKAKKVQIAAPVVEDSEDESEEYNEEEEESEEEESESEQEEESGDDEGASEGSEDEESEEDVSDDGFEDQGSSSDDEDRFLKQAGDSEDEDELEGNGGIVAAIEEEGPRHWSRKSKEVTIAREHELKRMEKDGTAAVAAALHVDDLSSDDEEAGNTIGKVPLRWYEDYEHIGYNLQGERIGRSVHKDGLASAIADHDDPNAKRTVYDALNDKEVVLSERDMEIIRRIQSGAYAHPEHEAHPDYIPYYTADEHVLPLSDNDPFKRRFTPSKWELMKITKIIKGLKDGSILPREEAEKRKAEAKEAAKAPSLLWSVADDDLDDLDARKGPMYIAAPKIALPGHAESYRPPDEYLLNEEEEALWHATPEEDREMNFLPKKFDSLREVGAFSGLVRERFERCLDLYLCPRSFKRRLQIDPESLVPKLPSPKDLKPFPNTQVTRFLKGHDNIIRGLAASPDGQYLISGDDDGKVCLWEVATGRLLKFWNLKEFNKDSPVSLISWNPNRSHHIVAVAAGNFVYLIATGTGGAEGSEMSEALLFEAESQPSGAPTVQPGAGSGSQGAVTWSPVSSKREEKANAKKKSDKNKDNTDSASTKNTTRYGVKVGVRVMLTFEGSVTSLCWHRKGDYFATAAPSAPSGNVVVHQLSKRSSQIVIKKRVNKVGGLSFHPSQPMFFVATQQHVRIYHLVKQRLVKKLLSGCKVISSIDVHPSGDHVILGSLDRRVVWFDLDRGAMPFKTLKYHTKAVRSVKFHRQFPLFATCSDDNTVQVFHSTVYSDLMKDPFIVPLKVLSSSPIEGSEGTNNGLGVASICFHPNQPWLFSAEKDNTIILYHDV